MTHIGRRRVLAARVVGTLGKKNSGTIARGALETIEAIQNVNND